MEKVVLVTGASSGIGLHTAKLFQTKNWKVAATMRRPEEAEELQKIVDVECIRLDVTDSASVHSAVAEAIEKFGRLDAVVNNAGYGLLGPFEATTEEQVRKQFDTNVLGLMNVCREVIPHFREQKSGHIVNIASMGGRTVFPFSSLYNATKWAVEGFSESLQYELEPFGIRVKIIEPGPINTDFYSRSQDVAKKEGLTAYDHYSSRFLEFMRRSGDEAPDGSVVAQAVYDSVTDGSRKLRYPVNTKGLLFLRSILPGGAYRMVTKAIFLR